MVWGFQMTAKCSIRPFVILCCCRRRKPRNPAFVKVAPITQNASLVSVTNIQMPSFSNDLHKVGSISLNSWRWQTNRSRHSSLRCPTSCSSHNAAQLLHTILASGGVQTNTHINTLGDVLKQLHHVSLDRTTVRLKGSPLGAGCIREIRRGRLLWRADLFNHVRHSGLSFCPFYYDILAPSSALSCHSLPSQHAIRACAPPLCRILACVLILMDRDTQERHTISRGRAVQIALWAYFGVGKRNNITWAAEAQFKMNQPFSPLLFVHIVPPLYHQISFCKRIS